MLAICADGTVDEPSPRFSSYSVIRNYRNYLIVGLFVDELSPATDYIGDENERTNVYRGFGIRRAKGISGMVLNGKARA